MISLLKIGSSLILLSRREDKTMGIVSIDALMKIDRGLITEVPTKEVRAKHLSKIMGTDVSVKIKALSGNTYGSLLAAAKSKRVILTCLNL